MSFPIRISIRQRKFPSQRAWTRASKAAHGEMGQYYHDVLIPQHFEPGAGTRYGYLPRKPGYKRRRKPGQPSYVERAIARGKAIPEALTQPLVFTGELKRSVTGLAVVKAYPSRATVTMVLPTHVPLRPRTNKQPPVADEATRVLGTEQRILAGILRTRMDKEFERECAKEDKTVNV